MISVTGTVTVIIEKEKKSIQNMQSGVLSRYLMDEMKLRSGLKSSTLRLTRIYVSSSITICIILNEHKFCRNAKRNCIRLFDLNVS